MSSSAYFVIIGKNDKSIFELELSVSPKKQTIIKEKLKYF
jgi:hypothetical protein